MNLKTMFQASVKKHPKKTAVIFDNQRVSYQSLDIRSSQVGGMLWELLKEEQKRVLILARNSVHALEVMLGCFKANMTACPINWRLSPYELAAVLGQNQFDLIFYDRETCPLLRQALEISDLQIEQIRLGGLKYESHIEFFAYNRTEIQKNIRRSDEDIAIQYFTSGTTGVPKGVLLSHGSLASYIETYTKVSEWKEDTVYQTSANLFHLSGFSILTSLLVGGTVVMMNGFRMEEFLTAMKREGVTRVSLVPTLINAIFKSPKLESYDFSRVKKIVYGGAPMLPVQIRQISQRLSCQLENAYGSTETCSISLLTGEDHEKIMDGTLPMEKLASVGRPLPGVEVRVEDEEGQVLPAGETGELLVKSPFLYKGYSNAKLRRSLTEDGYHHTGDIGYIDRDGYIFIVDRKHDMIVCGGENIYPKEVEICISKMVNCVQQVSVVGQPDPIWGEIVVAFVVAKPGVPVTAEDIISFCRHNIASYKKPKRVIFVEELPVNANGKISKQELRKWLAEGQENGLPPKEESRV